MAKASGGGGGGPPRGHLSEILLFCQSFLDVQVQFWKICWRNDAKSMNLSALKTNADKRNSFDLRLIFG